MEHLTNKELEEMISNIEHEIYIIDNKSICMRLTSYFYDYSKKKNQLLEEIEKLELEILYNEDRQKNINSSKLHVKDPLRYSLKKLNS
jgi:uncharacterized protein YydD (DUF2326 family)